MDWAAISALSAALVVIGGAFLWVVTMVTEKAIRDAVNGFKTKIELMDQRLTTAEARLREEAQYAHTAVHEFPDKIALIQREAFNAGRDSVLGHHKRGE